MANKKISELPYINGSKISGNTLVPLVTYFSATTGDTVHTYITDLQNYLTSGITASGNYLPKYVPPTEPEFIVRKLNNQS